MSKNVEIGDILEASYFFGREKLRIKVEKIIKDKESFDGCTYYFGQCLNTKLKPYKFTDKKDNARRHISSNDNFRIVKKGKIISDNNLSRSDIWEKAQNMKITLNGEIAELKGFYNKTPFIFCKKTKMMLNISWEELNDGLDLGGNFEK